MRPGGFFCFCQLFRFYRSRAVFDFFSLKILQDGKNIVPLHAESKENGFEISHD